MVKEPFFLMTSVIFFVWIRGHRSEVTKIVYNMAQVFHLPLHSYHSGFVGTISTLFCYVNIKLILCRLASYARMRLQFGLLLLLLLLF